MRLRQINMFHLLIHSPDSCSDTSWAGPKLKAQECNAGLQQGQGHSDFSDHYCLRGPHWQEAATQLRHSDKESRHLYC